MTLSKKKKTLLQEMLLIPMSKVNTTLVFVAVI